MNVHILRHIDADILSQINSLLHALNPDMPAITHERLNQIISEDSFHLFVSENVKGNIDGMLTLTRCHTLGRSKYWIEDVVVDPASRGKGVGRSLIRAAVSHVRETEENAVIYLTSNPSRVHARALYSSEGFEKYDTGVFRINL